MLNVGHRYLTQTTQRDAETAREKRRKQILEQAPPDSRIFFVNSLEAAVHWLFNLSILENGRLVQRQARRAGAGGGPFLFVALDSSNPWV